MNNTYEIGIGVEFCDSIVTDNIKSLTYTLLVKTNEICLLLKFNLPSTVKYLPDAST